MSLEVPGYLSRAMLAQRELRYEWDEWRIARYCAPDDESLTEAMEPIADNAICALSIAIAEWVIFRMRVVDPDPLPLQCAEAAWCAVVDRRYCEGLEVSPRTWRGPVRGPLGLAMNLMDEALYHLTEGAARPTQAPAMLSRLTLQVCGAEESFLSWRAACMRRLAQLYPANRPIDDLFDEQERQIIVPREAFDPNRDFDVSQTPRWIGIFLSDVDFRSNPFLNTPEQMRKQGFQGPAYGGMLG